MASTLDLLPTFLSLAGADLPAGRTLDGYDLSAVLFGTGPSPRKEMFYYHGQQLYAARFGQFKAHYLTKTSYTEQKKALVHNPPLLFHLGHDPGERYNLADDHADVLAEIAERVEAHKKSIVPVKNQLNIR